MENSPRQQHYHHPSQLLPSPRNSHSTNSSTSSSSSNSNGGVQTTPPPPQLPKTITRSETTPYPTTFVQADTTSFKQVVQMLTGSTETAKQASSGKPNSDPPKNLIPPIKTMPTKQQGFKLYERRNSLKNLKISPLVPGFVPNTSGFSPRMPEILSPSLLDFPGLALSPVTPLMTDPFNRSPHQNPSCCAAKSSNLDSKAEERAISEKGFYLHPSPSTTPRDQEPRLLPLFPVTSPRVSGSS